MRAAADLLASAQTDLEAVDTDGLTSPVASAMDQALTQVSERASTAAKAAATAELLPGFLGADGPRSYLIVMQNLSDPRGAGGYPGTYGLIHVDGHRIRLEELAAHVDDPAGGAGPRTPRHRAALRRASAPRPTSSPPRTRPTSRPTPG